VSKAINEFCGLVGAKTGGLVCVGDGGKKVSIDPITIVTLITTILPVIGQWFTKCRELKNDQAQESVAADNGNPRKSQQQRDALAKKILAECRVRKGEEIRIAKKTGLPADVGRYQIDTPAALRLADHMIGTFVAMPRPKASALVEACCGG
jgi:hypothetical protein